MTRPDLEAIRARCEAAAPGPWVREELEIRSFVRNRCQMVIYDFVRNRCQMVIYDEGGHDEQDAEFIAHARTDIPALIAYIDELERRTTYTIGETEWAHRIAAAEQRFVDEYDARKAAEREIAELKARIATLEAMKP